MLALPSLRVGGPPAVRRWLRAAPALLLVTREMRRHQAILRISVLLLVLAPSLGILVSTSALSADLSDNGPLVRIEPASHPGAWDSPATSTPAANSAALSRPGSSREETISGNPLWAVPLATLSNTRERPIFSQSRRPPPPPAVTASVPKAPPNPPRPPEPELRLSLVGTVRGDDQSVGIFVDQASKAILRLRIGQDYQGWRLRSVFGREVIMARGERSETLKFSRLAGAAPAVEGTLADAVRRGSSHSMQYD